MDTTRSPMAGLVGEVVRRISGKSLGTFFRDEIAQPLDLDFHIGLAEAEHGRVAEMGPMAMPGPDDKDALEMGQRIMADLEGMTARAFGNPPSMMAGVNVPEWRSAEIPGANGHTNARAIAKLYGIVALNDGRVISPGIDRGGALRAISWAGRSPPGSPRASDSDSCSPRPSRWRVSGRAKVPLATRVQVVRWGSPIRSGALELAM